MISAAEASVQRYNTRAFILADAEIVDLVPRAKTKNASGGTIYTDLPALTSQVMRLIPITEDRMVDRTTLDGRIVKPEFALLGEWDALLERGWLFSLNGNRYEIVYVHEKRDYEAKGEVAYVGRS